MDELNEAEEKERQQKEEERAATATATVSNKISTLGLEQFKVDPFASLNIPLLPPRV
jgi:hypothetical protein